MISDKLNPPQISKCPCCGGKTFQQTPILWKQLIKQWKLSEAEVNYINRQQGLSCTKCGSNLRSMSLAAAVMNSYKFTKTFKDFCKNNQKIKVLEINEAGHLTQFLQEIPGHTLAVYPEIDIMNLPYADNKYDLILHSDTLEHVQDPVQALAETKRVLKTGGITYYTIPIVVGRTTKRRSLKKPSYHGTPGMDDYLVYYEYGSDMWTQLFEAGFRDVRLFSIDYPASIVCIGIK